METHNKYQAQEIQLLKKKDEEQTREIQQLTRKGEEQTREIQQLTRKGEEQTKVINHQGRNLEKLMQTSTKQEIEMQPIKEIIVKEKDCPHTFQASRPSIRASYTEMACTRNNITLSCPENSHIFITSGIYAQYAYPCESGCCPPHPIVDCNEIIEENAPHDWNSLKDLCDTKSSCEVENDGGNIHECEFNDDTGVMSDYTLLYYDCLHQGDSAGNFAAFTAYSDTGSNSIYKECAVIEFEHVISNFGGHYNPDTSSFICPVNGIYLLSVTVQTYRLTDFAVDLMRDNQWLARAWADDAHGTYTQASSTIVTECNRGELLWVQTDTGGTLDAVHRHNVFSGLLINLL